MQVFEFVKDKERYNMTSITEAMTGKDVLPTTVVDLFQPADMVDTSLETLLTASNDLWSQTLETVRSRLSSSISPSQTVYFPIVTHPSMILKDDYMYIAGVLPTPTQVYLHRTGRNTEETAVVQLASPVIYAEVYHHSSLRLLTLTCSPSVCLQLSDISQVVWRPETGQVQPVTVGKQRDLEGMEVQQVTVAQDRGLAAVVLNDRAMKLIDLEDQEN